MRTSRDLLTTVRWRAVLSLVAAVLSLHAQAQILDDIESKPQPDGVAVVLHFAGQVSYRRHTLLPSGDEVQIYFAVTAAGDTNAGNDDVRDIPAGNGLPRLTVRLPAGNQTSSLRRLDIRFDSPVQFLRVGPGPDNRTLLVFARANMQAPAQANVPRQANLPLQIEVAPTPNAAHEPPDVLLAGAKSALAQQQYEQAVAALNRLLDLPPNAQSQEAQELIGDARAALGENERARAEYKLYLKLYPNSAAASGVQKKMDALGAGGARVAGAPDSGTRDFASRITTWGSVSQFYYGGQSQIRNETTIITPATDATQIDVQNISSKDQSSLVTNLDANARYRGDGWDNRFVVRDVHVLSLISAQPTRNRLSALYADFKNEPFGVDARFGRQSSTSGGVLGRFDGAMAHYRIAGDWRVGAFGGVPVEEGIGKSKYFYGLTLDDDHLLGPLGLGLFAIEQRTEGFVDRRALGAELRYFTEKVTALSLFDYDIRYQRVNIGSFQGTLLLDNGATLNLLYDYRRSPTLQLTNSLLGTSVSSLDKLRELQSEQQIERDAVGLTPISKVVLFSGTWPMTQQWQLGSEVRVSSISGTHSTATQPAIDGSGNVYSYTVQAIGTGIVGDNGVLVFSGSRLHSEASDAWLASMNTRYRPNQFWSIEPQLRYYTQDASNDTQLQRISPTLRVTYQFTDRISLESEISLERSHTKGKMTDEKSDVVFYYLGYHWDF